MKLIYAGTPAFAAAALTAILAAGHEVTLVLTQPDRPAGRGMQPTPSAVKTLALAHGLSIYQPERLKDPASHEPIRAAVAAGAELMVVAAYGLILPPAVLDLPPRGCLNIHASLLPRWRGAAPIQRAIEAGDAQTGITLMQMDAGLDTGAMLLRESLPIAADDTAASLHDKLAAQGARLITQALADLDALAPTPQPEAGVTYAAKILKSEAALDWRQAAETLARQIRAFDPFPGATARIDDSTLKIWRAEALAADTVAAAAATEQPPPGSILSADAAGVVVACGSGNLRLEELQKSGGKRLPAREFLAGFALPPGARFHADTD
ncbi:10-formyltetrahydrofolate:L-methionyl-tRNA(fMet) N-formyltransferase [Sterolibacterium denitrificans]|uniref:Methionyl-tRNA formyltransferase n=1 Tax=Sterolibacterium denitrificans TaxID=157592 RepID=A0A7Z7HP29_9PROT|nr:methionyl-tRNA formyltransferase [Sterolibacterium denitrificans]SMB22035.1 10-formyltetrahydrofolate:L-methionyl-tRNA(fMet) N-formyltransferase [Sterolibacterium denitrificans]